MGVGVLGWGFGGCGLGVLSFFVVLGVLNLEILVVWYREYVCVWKLFEVDVVYIVKLVIIVDYYLFFFKT